MALARYKTYVYVVARFSEGVYALVLMAALADFPYTCRAD